jgi:hypothetical protein
VKVAIQFLPIVVLILGASSSGQAQSPTSQSATDLDGSKMQTVDSVLAIPPAIGNVALSTNGLAFHPFLTDTLFAHAGVALYNTEASIRSFETPINLPNGARINQIVYAYIDNNAASDISLILGYNDHTSLGGSAMTWVSSTGASSEIRYTAVTAIAPNIIDNENNNYYVEIMLPPGESTIFVSFRIDYSYNLFAPMINK